MGSREDILQRWVACIFRCNVNEILHFTRANEKLKPDTWHAYFGQELNPEFPLHIILVYKMFSMYSTSKGLDLKFSKWLKCDHPLWNFTYAHLNDKVNRTKISFVFLYYMYMQQVNYIVVYYWFFYQNKCY